jgi:hypothetical protein
MAALTLPKAIVLMIVALIKSKGAASKTFIQTKHELIIDAVKEEGES